MRTRYFWLSGAALSTLVMASSFAQAQDLGLVDYDVIILGGGKSPADASKAISGFSKAVFLTKYIGADLGGWPQTRVSGDIKGLNPGFHIAVLGFCRHSEHSADERKNLLKLVRKYVSGAYTRQVRGAFGDPCPPVSAFAEPNDQEQELRAAIKGKPKDPEALYQYALFLQGPEQVRFLEAQAVLEALLKVAPEHERGLELSEKLMVLMTY